MIEEIARETGLPPDKVPQVIEKTFAHVHRGLYERQGPNGNYVGGALSMDLGYRAFLHFIGIVLCTAEDYGLEDPGEFTEYADRIVPADIHREVLSTVESWERLEPR